MDKQINIKIESKDIFDSVKSDNLDLLKKIITENPELINTKDELGRTPLIWACRNSSTELIEYLLNMGADVNLADNNNIAPVHILASKGDSKNMEMLLTKDADVDFKAGTGLTALHYNSIPEGIFQQRVLIYIQLLSKGADHTMRNKNGDTPLNFAVENSVDREMIKTLLNYNADYNAEGNRASLLMQKAAQYGFRDFFIELLKKEGKRVLDDKTQKDLIVKSAAIGGETDILKTLTDMGFSIDTGKNVYGLTLIHYAAKYGHEVMIEYLTKLGVDINSRNNVGESAYNIAEKNGNKKIMELILKLGGNDEAAEFTVLKGKYLGQTVPGMKPEIFAPGIISTDEYEGCSGWGKNMEYFVFQRWTDNVQKLCIMNRNEDDSWTEPEEIPFGEEYQCGDFTIAPDGKTLLFASRKDTQEYGLKSEGTSIWKSIKTQEGWTEPELLKSPINSEYNESYPCMASNGNLYFFSMRPGGFGRSDLYMSELVDGEYKCAVNMGPDFNSENYEWDPFIAPDESYIIFCSMNPGGPCDYMYVSFKNEDGTWGKPVYLGDDINSDKSDNRPYVTPDGKYLFFCSRRSGEGDIYWVDAKILGELKKKQI